MFQIPVPVFVATVLIFIGSVCFGGRVLHPDSLGPCCVLNMVVRVHMCVWGGGWEHRRSLEITAVHVYARRTCSCKVVTTVFCMVFEFPLHIFINCLSLLEKLIFKNTVHFITWEF